MGRDFVLLLVSAVSLVLPFHFGELWGFSFFAFIPYFFAIDNKNSGAAFRLSFLWGALFFVFLGYWLTFVNVLGFILMVLYLALYFAFFGMWTRGFLNAPQKRVLLFVPAFWVIVEVLRGWIISGIPWALLGYSQWQNTSFIQIADITGAYGVSFVIVLVNLVLFRLLKNILSRKKAPAAGVISSKALVSVLAVVLLGLSAYGIFSLKRADAFYKNSWPKSKLRLSLVQGNIPQDQKWDARIKGIIFEKYKRLTLMSAVEKSDLIIWPETSFPGYLEDEPILAAQLRALVRQTRTHVLVGAPTLGDMERGLRFYNSAILFGPDGEEKKRYHKVHLVPFGEYIPLGPVLAWLRNFWAIGRFSPGDEQTIFSLQSQYQTPPVLARFGVLICYEDIFPGLVRKLRSRGADFLINMTNDAWFGKTKAPYQHAQASVFRAVENRIPVVRATNTGLSCFISPEGRILASVEDQGEEIFVTGHKMHEIILGAAGTKSALSFYARFGDIFALLAFAAGFWAWRQKSRRDWA
jgi:apolipoprotein N-acyltransferase